MNALEQELQEITKTKQKAKEDRQAYLVRLIEAVQDLQDDQWEKISTPAQNWVNEGAKQNLASSPVVDFEPDPPETDDETEQEDEVATKTLKKKPAKPAKVKAEPKKPAKVKEPKVAKVRSTAPKDTGVKVRIKKMIMKRSDITTDQIVDQLSKSGDKPSKLTVAAIRAEFRHSLFVLKDAGWPQVEI